MRIISTSSFTSQNSLQRNRRRVSSSNIGVLISYTLVFTVGIFYKTPQAGYYDIKTKLNNAIYLKTTLFNQILQVNSKVYQSSSMLSAYINSTDVLVVSIGAYFLGTERSPHPTSKPTHEPSKRPTLQPTRQPSLTPTNQPISRPTCQPTTQPTSNPSISIETHFSIKLSQLVASYTPQKSAYSIYYYKLIVRNSSLFDSCSMWKSFISDLHHSSVSKNFVSLSLIQSNSYNVSMKPTYTKCSNALESQNIVDSILKTMNDNYNSSVRIRCDSNNWIIKKCLGPSDLSICINCVDPCNLKPCENFGLSPCNTPLSSFYGNCGQGMVSILSVELANKNGNFLIALFYCTSFWMLAILIIFVNHLCSMGSFRNKIDIIGNENHTISKRQFSFYDCVSVKNSTSLLYLLLEDTFYSHSVNIFEFLKSSFGDGHTVFQCFKLSQPLEKRLENWLFCLTRLTTLIFLCSCIFDIEFVPDDGTCSSYTSIRACNQPKLYFDSNYQKCHWTSSSLDATVKSITLSQPQCIWNDYNFSPLIMQKLCIIILLIFIPVRIAISRRVFQYFLSYFDTELLFLSDSQSLLHWVFCSGTTYVQKQRKNHVKIIRNSEVAEGKGASPTTKSPTNNVSIRKGSIVSVSQRIGRVDNVSDDRYDIVFVDGSKEEDVPRHLISIPGSTKFESGNKVSPFDTVDGAYLVTPALVNINLDQTSQSIRNPESSESNENELNRQYAQYNVYLLVNEVFTYRATLEPSYKVIFDSKWGIETNNGRIFDDPSFLKNENRYKRLLNKIDNEIRINGQFVEKIKKSWSMGSWICWINLCTVM